MFGGNTFLTFIVYLFMHFFFDPYLFMHSLVRYKTYIYSAMLYDRNTYNLEIMGFSRFNLVVFWIHSFRNKYVSIRYFIISDQTDLLYVLVLHDKFYD